MPICFFYNYMIKNDLDIVILQDFTMNINE